MQDFICIAHRGASGHWPENTLLAFRKALEAGAVWLELDVHLTADGRLVVIHDDSLERTTDGRGLVARQPFVKLRRLDAGLGEKIPLLEEVLALATGRAAVNIELKGAGTGEPVARLLQHLAGKGLPRVELLASSLSEKELKSFSARLPQVSLALVSAVVDRDVWQLAAELGVWSLHLDKSCIDQQLVAQARDRQIRLFAYTVNARQELQCLRNWGVAGIFTDYPERFCSQKEVSFHG